jgi:hypothetical protein
VRLYESGVWKEQFPQFPRIVVMTDKPVDLSGTQLRFIKLPLSSENLRQILKIN